jgi:CBS domain-containing protein
MLSTAPSDIHGIAELMTRQPIVIGPGEPLRAAATLLNTCRVRHLPVLVSATLVGILSLRDVLAAHEEASVGEAMTPAPQTAAPHLSVAAAAKLMLSRHISCLPVLEDGALVGIFTATDALRFAAAELEQEGAPSGHHSSSVSVSQLMTARPVVVEPQTPLAAAWRTMKRAGIRHLPVGRGDELVGMLSDRDVLATGRVWLDGAPTPDALVVADAMSPRVVAVDGDRPALEAARILLRRRLGALPVMHGHGRLQGIVSVSDFLYWIIGRA